MYIPSLKNISYPDLVFKENVNKHHTINTAFNVEWDDAENVWFCHAFDDWIIEETFENVEAKLTILVSSHETVKMVGDPVIKNLS